MTIIITRPISCALPTWAAYSDASSFRDALQGRSFEETFGGDEGYEQEYGISYGGQYSPSNNAFTTQPRNYQSLTQQKTDSNSYGQGNGGQRYDVQSPANIARASGPSGIWI